MTPSTENAIQYQDLSKIQKLSYLFVVLGPESSAPLLKQFDEDTLENICREMSQIKVIPAEIKKKLLQEFSSVFYNCLDDVISDQQNIKKTLQLSQGEEKAQNIFTRVLKDPACTQMTQIFNQFSDIQIFNTLKVEQEQTIAFLLACLPPNKAKQILQLFDQEKKESILMKMGTMQPIPSKRIEQLLQIFQKLCVQKTKQADNQAIEGGPMLVANILNSYKKDDKETLLSDLSKKDTDLTKAIEKFLFTFEDLAKLSKEDLQKVIREVDTQDLIVALKSAPDNLLNLITGAMSKRAAASLKEELENLGPTKLKDVELAREKIVTTVRGLESQGALILDNDENELLLQ